MFFFRFILIFSSFYAYSDSFKVVCYFYENADKNSLLVFDMPEKPLNVHKSSIRSTFRFKGVDTHGQYHTDTAKSFGLRGMQYVTNQEQATKLKKICNKPHLHSLRLEHSQDKENALQDAFSKGRGFPVSVLRERAYQLVDANFEEASIPTSKLLLDIKKPARRVLESFGRVAKKTGIDMAGAMIINELDKAITKRLPSIPKESLSLKAQNQLFKERDKITQVNFVSTKGLAYMGIALGNIATQSFCTSLDMGVEEAKTYAYKFAKVNDYVRLVRRSYLKLMYHVLNESSEMFGQQRIILKGRSAIAFIEELSDFDIFDLKYLTQEDRKKVKNLLMTTMKELIFNKIKSKDVYSNMSSMFEDDEFLKLCKEIFIESNKELVKNYISKKLDLPPVKTE